MLEIYIACLVLGFVLLGAEIYVPGGVLGTLGGLALLGAIIAGFQVEEFGTQGGVISALIIVLTVVAGMFFWLRYFPSTPAGKKLALADNESEYKADNEKHRELVDKTGVAVNNLRPSGIARIGGERIDVVADGSWIEKGSEVKVIDITGNRIVVRKLLENEANEDESV